MEAETYLVHVTVPPELEVTEWAEKRLRECEQFLNSIPSWDVRYELWKTLQNCLTWIGNIARNFPMSPASLGFDHAPLSLGWKAGSMNGGLIFHAPNEGTGNYPVLHVLLTGHAGWQLHS